MTPSTLPASSFEVIVTTETTTVPVTSPRVSITMPVPKVSPLKDEPQVFDDGGDIEDSEEG